MKLNKISLVAMLLFTAGCLLASCEKDASEKEYGFSKIYMPQAIYKSGGVTNNYPVPTGTDSSTYNYKVNTKDKTIDVVLGATLSGPGADAYSVEVQVNNDTIQQLLTNKVLDPNLYKLMPASMYTIPSNLEIPAGKRSGTFTLAVDIAQLKSSTYAGKYLLLAVKLANPSSYELNPALSTTVVVIDVDALVIGPAKDITIQYIQNPGNPFIASVMMSGNTRWGSLQNWSVNAAAASHGGTGGYSKDGDGQTMDLESGWGSPQILNGKIYQTVTLPAGSYAFDPSGGSWKWQGTKDPAYVVVAPNADVLPDYSNITNNAEIIYQVVAQPQKVTFFELSATTKVTLGIVVNYVQDGQGFKSTAVKLYNYPKHL